MSKKCVLNIQTKKIHLINGCAKSKNMKPENIVSYYTEDEAIAEAKEKYDFSAALCGNCYEKTKDKK